MATLSTTAIKPQDAANAYKALSLATTWLGEASGSLAKAGFAEHAAELERMSDRTLAMASSMTVRLDMQVSAA